MDMKLRVLVLEDSEPDVKLIVHELRRSGITATIARVDNEADFHAQLATDPEIILSDFNMPQFDAMRALELLQESKKDIPFIIMSGSIGEDVAVEAMRRGAWDYVLKDRPARLGPAVTRAIEQRQLREARRQADSQIHLQATTLAAAANGIVITDEHGIILWTNPAFTTMSGYAAEELCGQSTRLLKSGQHDRRFYENLWHTVLAGNVWHGEIINRRKDGTLYVEEQSITPVRGADGKVAHFIAIKQDVTSRKHTQQELAEGARVASLAADIGLALTRPGLLLDVLLQCATAVVRRLQIKRAHIWTLTPTGAVDDQVNAGAQTESDIERAVVAALFANIAARREPHFVVNERGAFAGFPLLVGSQLSGVLGIYSTAPLSDTLQQRLPAIADQLAVGVERLRTAKSLQEANENLRALIDAAPLAIFAINAERRVTTWNPAAERLFGMPADEAVGKPLAVVPSEKRAEFEAFLERGTRPRPNGGLETQWLGRDGGRIDLNLFTAPIVDAAGARRGSIVLIIDTSAHKQLEEQYRQAQKMEAIGRLAGGVAHDFNNLLTVITGYADVLKGELNKDDPLWTPVEEISIAADRAAGLTQQLLAFSRKQILVRKQLDLNELVADAAKLLRRLIGADVELITKTSIPLRPVMGDPTQMNQIILNLAVNARDAMPRGGKLTIETANVNLDEQFLQGETDVRPGPFVLLSVSDTGSGIAADVLPKIFEPFFTTKAMGKGTGLGLATVYGIVRQSDGLIRVSSVPGQGATFKLYFPLAQGGATYTTARPSAAGLPRTGAASILLIEDDPALRSLARLVLEGHGYKVLEARSGAEALALCDDVAQRIDLVLSDVVMPGLSGKTLGDSITRLRPAVPILYMSGYVDDTITHHGIETGMQFLQKPFTPQALLRKVRDVLEAKD